MELKFWKTTTSIKHTFDPAGGTFDSRNNNLIVAADCKTVGKNNSVHMENTYISDYITATIHLKIYMIFIGNSLKQKVSTKGYIKP